MINLGQHENVLKLLATEYFVGSVVFVPDLAAACRDAGVTPAEPGQPMVVAEDSGGLKLMVQSEVKEGMLDGVVRGLGVRWALRDNATDIASRLDTVKKRLGFCFLKDYSRTVPDVGGDELREDEWAVREMERLGFFRE